MSGKGKRKPARVVSVNVSKETGEKKEPIKEAELKEDFGIKGDVHGGQSVKQISILDKDLIDRFEREHETSFEPGDFAENLTTRGLNFSELEVSTKLRAGKRILLRVSKIGKECHEGCAIREETGYCIMPEKGIFCQVLEGGRMKPGDRIEILPEDGQ